MKGDIRAQRLERELLQKTIDTLESQTETQREKVKFCESRVAELEM